MITYDAPWLAENDTLICFGDSLTAAKSSYVEILQERLKPRGITVIKSGRGGDKTPWALTRLYPDVIDRKPKALSIFLGTNDGVVGRGRWADEPRVTPEAYRCNLVWIMHLCRLSGIQKFSVTPPLWHYEGDLYLEYGDAFAPYRYVAREAADEMRARFVPADIAFEQEWQKHPGRAGLMLTVDGGHLNDAGNRLVADAMLKAWGMASATNAT